MTSKRNRRLNGCSGRISLFKTKETGRKQMELPVNQKLGCRPWFYIEDPYNLPSGGYPMSLCLNSGFGTACTWIWYMIYWIEDSLLTSHVTTYQLYFGTASCWIKAWYIELRIVYLPRFSSAPNDPLVLPLPSGGTPTSPILNSGFRIASSLMNEKSDYLLARFHEH